MKIAIVVTIVGVAAVAMTACSSGPHEQGAPMLAGQHVMPAPKGSVMPDASMPSRSPDCSPEALAKMPPEHRQACQAQSNSGGGQSNTQPGQHVMPAPKGGVMPNSSMPTQANPQN